MPDNAVDAKEPRLGIGADTPNPKKLKKLSVNIALGICNAVLIIMTLILLGIRCFLIIHPLLAPTDFDAKTNSCSFKLSI